APRPTTVQLLVRSLGLSEAEAATLLRAAHVGRERVPGERPSNDLHNLPLPITSFVGREDHMAQVRRMVESTRLLTLTGMGGIGKTRLALQLATTLDRPDGVWFVELAALADPSLIPLAVARVLGVREQPGSPIAATLLGALRRKQLVVVLDNCEH